MMIYLSSFLFMVLFCARIYSQEIVLEKLDGGSLFSATCVVTGEDMESAISWITRIPSKSSKQNNIVSVFIPTRNSAYKCDITEYERCKGFWTNQEWKLQNSLSDFIGPVLDRRWEELETFHTDASLSFNKVIPLVNTKLFEFHVSIRTLEAHIYLCDYNYAPYANCYWILLGAWNGNKTALRKCSAYSIPNAEYVWPKEPCYTLRSHFNHTNETNALETTRWSHFTIRRNRNNILLYKLGLPEPLLNYTDTEDVLFETNTAVFLSRNKNPGYFKVHNYDYSTTNQIHAGKQIGEVMTVSEDLFCASFFVAMCNACMLIVEVQYYDNTIRSYQQLKQITLTSKQDRIWHEEKIIARLNVVPAYVRLLTTTDCTKCDNPFWAVDYFELCTENEIRVMSTSLSLQEASCEVIKPSLQVKYTNVVTGRPQTTCNNGMFGKDCLKCSSIFGLNKFYCDNSIICEREIGDQNVCRCAKGYRGRTCEEKCPYDTYGYDCQETCGHCSYPPCHYASGFCPAENCLYSFGGPMCKLPPSPFLRYPPTILEVGHTTVTVQLQNLLYEGNEDPAFYKIQYKSLNQTEWESSEIIDFNIQLPIKVLNLTVLTTYLFRGVLITGNNTTFERDIVPYTNATTTCELVQRDDIDIQVFNTSGLFTLKNNEESCPSIGYSLQIENQIITSKSFVFKITPLTPFTQYTARLYTNVRSEFELQLDFQTAEGAPQRVINLNAISVDESTLEVSWNAPSMPNGIIRYYEVTYKHNNYLGCPADNNLNFNFQRTLRELSNVTRIYNLIPYSQYRIEVVAYTVMIGEVSAISVDTQASEIPNEAEIPSIRSIKLESTKINIFMNPPNCTFVRGLLNYYVFLECHNFWCTRQSPITLNFSSISFQEPLVLTNLLPYSNYTVSVNIGRKNGKMSSTTGMTAVVRTDASVPHPIRDIVVFSKNESSISFRFSPPYPPTGVLAEIFLYHCSRRTDCYQYYIPLQQCKLWPDVLCITVASLRKDTDYELLVSSKNHGTNYSEPTKFFAKTRQEAPEAPQNVSAAWDDYYNLTLSWIHPSITNGPLTQFFVIIFSSNGICLNRSIPITEEDYQLLYNYEMQINESCYASKLNIYVHSYNVYSSPGYKIEESSPPRTPYIIPNPTVLTITNSTVSLDLQGVSNVDDAVQLFIFVSSDADSGPNRKVYQEQLWQKANIPKDVVSWIAGDYNVALLKATQNPVIIGNDLKSLSPHLQIEVHNKPLLSSTNYTIRILLVNEFNGKRRHSVYILNVTTTGSRTKDGSSSNALFALVLLLLIPIVAWFAVRYHRKKNVNWNSLVTMVSSGDRGSANPDVIPLTTEKVFSQSNLSPVNSIKKPEIVSKVSINNEDIFSKPIKLTDFEDYVKQSIENGELERQHQLFPRGQTKPWDYGILPQNKSKNRYNNLVAYDHTRVKLEKIDGDDFSDYINANYIQGYKTSKGYIATQGPKATTVIDFWRMIWQEKVNYIVMLANVIEGGKKKTEQYWPNVAESLMYGDIQVDYLHSEIYADYEYRTFAVRCKDEERTVEQLHFVSWPDHGVPLYSQSLVPFLRKLLTIPQGKAPVVVHCSAGVGRTGTIILCDLCLRMAAREGIVDVLKHQHNLRQQRANLVDNVEQYKLAHLVLLECLIAPQTHLPCDESIAKSVQKVVASNSLQHYMEYLKNTEWQDHAMQTSVTTPPLIKWETKNRFQDIVPNAYGRVYISRYPVDDEHSDYINAVEVDGFRAPQRFIATQQPLPHTIGDFWRMVEEKEVATIISLNIINKDNLNSCLFWPTQKGEEIKPVPYLKLKFHNELQHSNYAVITLHLDNVKNKKSNKRTVNLIIFKKWLSSNIVPDNQEDLLELWEEMEKVSRGNNNPIVVTCYNGATACGLFLSLAFLIEKIKLEQLCDVCLAVRTVRRNRKQFVTDKEQFIFLYQTALLYLSGFSLYSNFSPASTSTN